MVLGIFAVIVSILAVAAWSVTQDDLASTGVTDGGALAEVVNQQTRDENAAPLGKRADDQALLAWFEQRKAERQGGENRVLERPERKQVENPGLGGIDSSKPRSPYVKRPSSSSGAPGQNGSDRLAQGPAAHPKTGRDEGNGNSSGPPIALKAGTPAAGNKGRNKPGTHLVVVKEHDTLWGILSRCVAGDAPMSAKLAATLSLNSKLTADSISPGQRIVLPVRVDANGPPVQAAAEVPSAPHARSTNGPDTPRLYTVLDGDSLGKIALRLLGKESRYKEIFELNSDRLTDAASIRPGMTLRMPEK
jgi:LysM repeat protein